jgi:Cu(I)/Ag(I) efflux system membrane protein CusA/SilA
MVRILLNSCSQRQNSNESQLAITRPQGPLPTNLGKAYATASMDIALFGIAVETGVVMVVYLHEALDRKLAAGSALRRIDIEPGAIEGAVQRLRPKLMTVAAVLASLVPILWETGVGSDVMKPIAAPIVGGMITSTINVLILVPIFFVMMKARALRQGKLQTPEEADA